MPPDQRSRVIAAVIRLLETDGPAAVQARKVAAETGTSTMAVYTYFGGMPELFEAVVREGFVRFADHVAAVPETDEPLTDFFVEGMAYRDWALGNPQLYRLMFGLAPVAFPKRSEQDMTVAGTISSLAEAQDAFAVMVRALDRIKAAGQIDPVDAVAAAGQFLSLTHGYVLLEMAGYFGAEGHGFDWVFGPSALSLMMGLGASRQDVERAAVAALAAIPHRSTSV